MSTKRTSETAQSPRVSLPSLLVFAVLLAAPGRLATHAAVLPYSPDPGTLHLWHLDEPAAATNCTDALPGRVTLTAIANGATLGNVSFAGFGAAASTYDAGPTATLNTNANGFPGRDAYLGPLPLAGDTSDNTTLTYTGTNGAFTIEALVRADFNPTTQAVAPDTSRYMQIISADAEEALRLFQFRVNWSSVNDTTPELQFINISSPIQTLLAVIPTTGSNAIAAGNWYHVAVAYNGQPNTADNLKLYWTKVETNRTQASILASLRMTNNLPAGSADWTIGNEGRSTGGADGNWVGLIDEVRLSGVARGPNDFVFVNDVDGDGLPDIWETNYFGSLVHNAAGDPDTDTFTNLEEYQGGSNPNLTASTPTDTDADGLPDVWENTYFGSLAQNGSGDPDGDGFTNAQELAAGTNPNNAASSPGDTDGDGLPDAWEQTHFGSLAQGANGDFDNDGFSNLREYQAGTLPNNASSFPPGPKTRFIPIDDGNTNTSEFGYAGASSINTVSFIRSALMTVSNQQFIAYYGRHATDSAYSFNDKIWIGRRNIASNVWEVLRTSFTANNIADGHDVVSFGLDGAGYLHMSWGMHGGAYHYAKSTAPVTGTNVIALGPDGTMTGKENNVTYPEFVSLPNGDLLYFFREGSSGNGDLFINRYYTASQSWSNLHLNGANQLAFIKGTGWAPNYNAYWNLPLVDANGKVFLTWTWRYNDDSPAGESGYQTNHDFDYAWSPDGGFTWRRSNGANYVLPINERGENGNTNSIAEKILSIPEGSSVMNQSGSCLDQSGQPVFANWWAAGAITNNHRRQYFVAFPGTNGAWQVRQISQRTMDSPANKVPESALGDMGRPTIVCDKDDRLIVIYRDNEGSNGLTVVHSLPRALDPDRLNWTTFDLTTENLGRYDTPVADFNRWEVDNVLHVIYQPSNGQGYTAPANTAAQIGVLEWDAAAYFAHRPALTLSLVNQNQNAAFSWNSQPGWGYRLLTSTNLSTWSAVVTTNGTGSVLQHIQTNAAANGQRFWRLELQEGGIAP